MVYLEYSNTLPVVLTLCLENSLINKIIKNMLNDLNKNTTNKRSFWIKKVFAFSFLIVLLFSNTFVYAVGVEFIPLERNAPWGTVLNPNDPKTFFQQVFNTLLAVAATLAVLMIMYGGVKYMTTDAWTGKEEAKDIIKNAVWGLVLALVSWLILYIINPDILSLRI